MALAASRIGEPPAAPTRAVPLALTLIAAVAITDVVVDGVGDRDAILEPLLVVGPLVAATRARPAHVGVVAAIAVAMAVLLGLVDGGLADTDHLLAIAAVAGGSALAVGVARAHDLLAGTVRERGAELEAERSARRRADLLARSGQLLESPLDPETMLARITGLPVPDHADLAIVDLLQADGSLRGAVTNTSDPVLATTLRRLRERFPLKPDGPHPVALALRTGQPQLLPRMSDERLGEIATNAEHLELMRAARYRSALVLPLTARGRTAGALSLLRFDGAAPFTEDDLALARELARHAALALDNARLYSDLQGAEQRLEAIVSNLTESVTAFAPDGRLVFANAAAAELVGAPSAQAMVGARVGELPRRWTLLDEQGREIPFDDQPIARALAGEPAEPLLVHAVERATGRDLWLVNRVAEVPGEDRAARLIVHVSEDVTAVKRQELRERILSNASKLLGSSLDVTSTIDKAAWAAVPELADWARIDLPDERGVLRQAAVAHRELEHVELLHEWRRDFPPRPEDHRGPWEVLRTGESVVWERVDPDDVVRYAQAPRHAELMRAIDTRSMIIVPLRAGDRILGTMQLATTSASHRMLGPGELDLAQELARRAAIAVEHAQVHAERTHIATTLQRSLLPPRLPVIPGLTIAARFRAAGAASEVGGDFYDLFRGRDGWVVLIGDVTGKGPAAAAITSLARYTMRTVAQYEDDPRAMLERLNATLGADGDRRQICTAACVVIRDSPRGGIRLDVARAGHPPPLLVRADGRVEAVGHAGTLLGAFAEGRWPVAGMELAPGDTLVLYTDGVTDTRGTDERFGVERLEAVLRELGPADPDTTAQRIDEALQGFGEQRDDVALLVLRAAAVQAAGETLLHAEEGDAA